ncbi:AraC family transcriptional regulator [Nannocystis pusilla]|uniref:helix-turn-helix transcriptional regulator n=1 Tax=Nannocystis pusilla TaxID=889268 RepID=UPI003BF3A96D
MKLEAAGMGRDAAAAAAAVVRKHMAKMGGVLVDAMPPTMTVRLDAPEPTELTVGETRAPPYRARRLPQGKWKDCSPDGINLGLYFTSFGAKLAARMSLRDSIRHDRCPVRVIRGQSLPDVEVHHGVQVRDAFEPHFHAAAHVIHVLAGARKQTVGRRQHTLAPGDVLVVPPDEVHSGASAHREGWTFVSLYCSPAALERAADELEPDAAGELGRAVRFELTDELGSGQLVTELAAALDDTPLAAQTAWLALTSRLLRGRREPAPRRRERALVKQAREFLDAHLAASVTLDQLAAVTGVSKEHVVRSFTADVGLAPHSYQLNARIEQAKQSLLAGSAISDVALALGFHDQSHFARHFRRIVGIPPGRFMGPRRGA